MKLVIFHYHLDTGGVTSVILGLLKAVSLLDNINEIVVLSGRPVSDEYINSVKSINPNVCIKYNENLNYLDFNITLDECKQKYKEIESFFEDLVDDSTIFHAHNSSIGKNPLVTIALWELSKKGVKILNQIHDFAEDNRALNYVFLRKIIKQYFNLSVPEVLYPHYKNCIYAVLNSRDLIFLSKAGIHKDRIVILPNCIEFEETSFSQEQKNESRKKLQINDDLPIYLYPVRIIRRKNVGEFILFSLLFKDKAHFVISRAPTNPVEIKFYDKWKQFCLENDISVCFEAGKLFEDFYSLIGSSDKVVSTSVIEGFGMIFIEPWMLGVGMTGRVIPDITSDFLKVGLKYSSLYDKLWIPVSLAGGKDLIVSKYLDYISHLIKSYEANVPLPSKEHIIENKIKDDKIDFADLDDEMQRQVILKIGQDEGLAKQIFEDNVFLLSFLDKEEENIVEENKILIKSHYSTYKYVEYLSEIYQKCFDNEKNEDLDNQEVMIKNRVLEYFFDINNLRLIQK